MYQNHRKQEIFRKKKKKILKVSQNYVYNPVRGITQSLINNSMLKFSPVRSPAKTDTLHRI